MKQSVAKTKLTNRVPRDAPLVSVIIPAYNVAPFIAETLNSVLAQSFTDYEIVVINDGSPDTEDLECALTPYLNRIIYLRQDNHGAGAARNAGLRVARGKYVAFLDGDDVWYPTHLSEQVALIDGGPGYDLVYADAVMFGNAVSGSLRVAQFNPSECEATFESILGGRCCVITSAVVARREPIMEVGLFDESLRNSQDFDLWLRLAKRPLARFNYQKKVLVRHRIYAGSLASDSIKSLEGELRVLDKTEQRQDLTPVERNTLERTKVMRLATVERIRAKRQLLEGDFTSAARSFQLASDYWPSWKLRLVLLLLRLAPRLVRRLCRTRDA